VTTLPLPDAPNRATARDKVRAAVMTGENPAQVNGYLCVTISATGHLGLASNADNAALGGLLKLLLAMHESGDLAVGMVDHPDEAAPDLN
jgi:hypothetical protein